jgi:hypothetical protein
MRSFVAASLFVLLLVAVPVHAQGGAPFPTSSVTSGESYATPRGSNLVPRSIFDPSRLSISNSMVFGYSTGGYGYGGGTAGLFTSSLGYRISNRAALRVDVGAHVNPAFGGNSTDKGIFLQSAAFDWRPTRNSLVRLEYRDMRSPLQSGYGSNGYGYGANPAYGGWGTPYGSNLGGDPRFGSDLPGDPLRN